MLACRHYAARAGWTLRVGWQELGGNWCADLAPLLARLLGLHPTNCVADQRRCIFQLQLLLDVAPMNIDGFRAEVKLLRDIAQP